MDAKEVVRQGYDRVAEEYARQAAQVRAEERDHYTQLQPGEVDHGLPRGAAGRQGGAQGMEQGPQKGVMAQFLAVGVDPDQPLPPGTFLLQTQARDTGDTVCGLAMPFYVKSKRYSAVRIGSLAE